MDTRLLFVLSLTLPTFVTLLVKLRWKLFSLAVIFVSYHLRRVSVLSPVYLESMIGTAK